MNFRILKFPLEEIVDEYEFEVTEGSQVLCVQMQHGKPCVWIQCPMFAPGAFVQKIKFRLLTTGRVYKPKKFETMTYVGTFQAHEGHFVGHVYRVQ